MSGLLSKESALMKIQQNKLLEKSRFQVQANLTSSVLQCIVRPAREVSVNPN